MSKPIYNRKYLTTTQRMLIEKGLMDGESFVSIGRMIQKHPSTIAKEVKKYRYFPERNASADKLPCALKKDCQIRFLCDRKDCVNLCKSCYKPAREADCRVLCPDYTTLICSQICKAPYVCNGCAKLKRCTLKHALYSAQQADEDARNLQMSCRDGINQSPADIAMLDELISPLLKQGQSLAHIYAHHGHEIPCSRRTLYNYIDKGVFSARNIDLRRRVRYKCKERKKGTRISLLARQFRIGRTYDDFCAALKRDPSVPVVEMDTVEGGRGNSKQAFLTMFFRNCSLMLCFVLPEKSQACVISVFDWLSEQLGVEIFQELFPVILTDNGTEFQCPARLECMAADGELRTKIYYCNPNSSWQKGMIEKNHSYIRYVIPKGQSLDPYTQQDITLLMNHINSEARDSMNGCTPFKLSLLLLNRKLHECLELVEILPDKVKLRPSLLK